MPKGSKYNISMTPYNALASGETSKRLEQDSYAKFKYDATKEQDKNIFKKSIDVVLTVLLLTIRLISRRTT